MSNRAWVTLATNDSYGLGALVLAHSLRRVGSTYPAVVLITPSVTEPMRDRLRAVFTEVVTVDVLDSRDAAHLALLQRPELGITFTKIHCWNLTQYEKCVFLDADILVVQNCDELFEREELSAAPDVGWPDCFNSGVFVYTPSADTFNRLVQFAQDRGSFDGGDQGLLNSFFSDWAHGDINKHLPFLYNVTSAAFYSYMPALKHYGQNLKIIHFIGAAKPWLQHFNWESRAVDAPEHLRQFLQLWWDLFVADVHAQLDVSMSGVAGNLARVTLGSSQREAIDELTRRQGWEAGNIDYMGVDSFDNIWAKISQTLTQARPSPPKQSPPRESTPPSAAPVQIEVQTGELAQEPVSDPVEVAKEVMPTEEPSLVQEQDLPIPDVSAGTAALSAETIEQIEPAVQTEAVALTGTASLTKTSSPTADADATAEVSTPVSVSAVTDASSIIQVQSVPEEPANKTAESVTPAQLPVTTQEPIVAEGILPAEKVVEQTLISEVSASDKLPVNVADASTPDMTPQAPEVIALPASIEVETITSAIAPSVDTAPEVEPILSECKEKTEVNLEEPVVDSVQVLNTDTKPQSVPVQEKVKEKTEASVTETAPAEPVTTPILVPSAEIAPPVESVPKLVEVPSTVPVSQTESVVEPITVVSADDVPPKEPAAVQVEVPSADVASSEEPVAIPVKVPSADAAPPKEPVAVPVKVPIAATTLPVEQTPAEVVEKTETPITKTASAEPAAKPPKAEEPAPVAALALPAESSACPIESTPEKPVSSDSTSDSPPLANTPSKEEIPDVSAAKSTEEAAQETRL